MPVSVVTTILFSPVAYLITLASSAPAITSLTCSMFSAEEETPSISARGFVTHSSSNSLRFVVNRKLQDVACKRDRVFHLLDRQLRIRFQCAVKPAVVFNGVENHVHRNARTGDSRRTTQHLRINRDVQVLTCGVFEHRAERDIEVLGCRNKAFATAARKPIVHPANAATMLFQNSGAL